MKLIFFGEIFVVAAALIVVLAPFAALSFTVNDVNPDHPCEPPVDVVSTTMELLDVNVAVWKPLTVIPPPAVGVQVVEVAA